MVCNEAVFRRGDGGLGEDRTDLLHSFIGDLAGILCSVCDGRNEELWGKVLLFLNGWEMMLCGELCMNNIPQNTLPLDALPQSDTTGIGSVNMTGECSIANSYTLMGFESNLDMNEFSYLFKLVSHNFRDEGSLTFSSNPQI
ncbi:hypothetical protein AVEN_48816-1 [Araneus ventricosus]|uniref:Uncharacterized protein n=1 Tax=Araneus ventricosus TaxID=182803 RepID=A0A4Y2U585_ARAVE|nr:hypothetical protein AVEN_48816-1 [Araneus ventricosus]